MNRREMLTAGFRHLARALSGLTTKPSLGTRLTGAALAPPPPEVSSFPKKKEDPAHEGPNPVKED